MAIGNGQVIEFTKPAVKAWLDEAITHFRKERDNYGSTVAIFYIDAYQSLRASLFDELLPEQSDDTSKFYNHCIANGDALSLLLS